MTGITHERRRTPRARTDFPLRMTQQAVAQPGTVVDISENGLCCTFPESIREMTVVKIDLQLPDREESHSLEGAVVRCDKRRNVSPPTYEVAVYFTDLPPDVRRELREFVTRSRTAAPPEDPAP